MSLRDLFAVSLNLFHSTAMLIYSTLEDEPRMDRCLVFNLQIMHMITDEMPRFHPRYSQRILYVGNDIALSKYLRATLADCQVVCAPIGLIARLFIEKLKHSVLLFDEELPDTTGQELADFTRQLTHRQSTPIIVRKSDDLRRLARDIRQLLASPQ